MTRSNESRYRDALDHYLGDSEWPYSRLMAAICWVQVGEYSQALSAYRLSLDGMLRDRRSWFSRSQPDLLVSAYSMAYQSEPAEAVKSELDAYRLDPRGSALVPLASYAEFNLLTGRVPEAAAEVSRLLKRSKLKDMYAIGLVVKSIAEKNQRDFDQALALLLRAHRGQAKFGALRESAEGYLCLHAMTLARAAREADLAVTVDSEYLSLKYLEYATSQGG